MFSIKIQNLVNVLVEHVLTPGGTEKKALYFHFDVSLNHHVGNGKSYGERRGLHLLYHVRHPHSAYVNVFSAVTSSPFEKIENISEWIHECSHDSCWRDIRVFADLYFEMAQRINDKLLKDSFAEVAPIEMDEHNMFVFDAKPFRWVDVEVSKDPNDSASYRKLVKLLPNTKDSNDPNCYKNLPKVP